MSTVLIKNYSQLDIGTAQVLKTMGCKEAVSEISSLIKDSIKEVQNVLSYRVCYFVLDVDIRNDNCDFSFFKVKSQSLAKFLNDKKKVVLFAATVGVELDRLIYKYSKTAPSKAVVIDAIGSLQIEALCDKFCAEFVGEEKAKRRFSAGYGDLPLETQKEIFSLLDCSKNIGLTLTHSLIMSPSKSVTAFLGIK
ncbi:MAG: vitamin B12 dependent-methionine synthase activation domain-containing protein [Acutalibacteraceae bacterium]|nr:vitamin B12 dependent-methionine synthase activation domain-containing protein [Acutalibacteraceae bacterium]